MAEMKNLKRPIVFDEVMDRIYAETGTRTQVEIAEVLGIAQSSISDAKGRNSIPTDWLFDLWRLKGLHPDWVLYGEGPKYLVPSEQAPLPSPSTITEQEKEDYFIERLLALLTASVSPERLVEMLQKKI